jgi:signal transduction histidine kinase
MEPLRLRRTAAEGLCLNTRRDLGCSLLPIPGRSPVRHHVLRSGDEPGTLAPQPGLAGLEQLVCGIRDAGLPVTLRIEGTPCPLPQALDLSAFRIVQEALTNTLKHAAPARAEVTVRYAGRAVELEIADTGTGAPVNPGTGHGLLGMRERVAMFGGELQTTRVASGGFTVRARLPLPPASA